jgi:hypothetical protein
MEQGRSSPRSWTLLDQYSRAYSLNGVEEGFLGNWDLGCSTTLFGTENHLITFNTI